MNTNNQKMEFENKIEIKRMAEILDKKYSIIDENLKNSISMENILDNINIYLILLNQSFINFQNIGYIFKRLNLDKLLKYNFQTNP